MTPKERAIRFYNDNGFFVVSCDEQQKAADELVAEGLLRQVKPEWFAHPVEAERWYVHASVDTRLKMPVGLAKLVLEVPPFFIGEIVTVELVDEHKMHASVYAKVNKRIDEDRYEVSILGTGTNLYPSRRNMTRTFDIDRRC
jgi:hypothetical protein